MMMNIILFIIMLFALSSILFLINFIISKKTNLNQEKMSPFECGSIQYPELDYLSELNPLLLVIFLIFEIALLLPLIYMSMNFNPFIIFHLFMFLFIGLILIIGLYTKYNEYSLDWKMM